MADNSAVLCYIDGPWAFFTSGLLEETWGDDWNDAPYEHNAGHPYGDGKAEITKIAWEGSFLTPCEGHVNSPYSVEMINTGRVPWLLGETEDGRRVEIMAGTTLPRFISQVEGAGGTVYVPLGLVERLRDGQV